MIHSLVAMVMPTASNGFKRSFWRVDLPIYVTKVALIIYLDIYTQLFPPEGTKAVYKIILHFILSPEPLIVY